MFAQTITMAFLLCFALVCYFLWLRYRVRTLLLLVEPDPILASVRDDSPVIVYFSNPSRLLCQTRQLPTLEQLRRELNNHIQIIEIDVTRSPDVAERWGVVTTPITFVLDASLHPLHINDGVASAETLRAQIGSIGY